MLRTISASRRPAATVSPAFSTEAFTEAFTDISRSVACMTSVSPDAEIRMPERMGRVVREDVPLLTT